MGRSRLRVKAGKSSDPEKMLLPGIVFCRAIHDDTSGFALAFGWWDYHVTLLFAGTKLLTEQDWTEEATG